MMHFVRSKQLLMKILSKNKENKLVMIHIMINKSGGCSSPLKIKKNTNKKGFRN